MCRIAFVCELSPQFYSIFTTARMCVCVCARVHMCVGACVCAHARTQGLVHACFCLHLFLFHSVGLILFTIMTGHVLLIQLTLCT